MIYSEVKIQKNSFESYLRSLDHDEGIRIDLPHEEKRIFINRWSATFTVDVSSHENSVQDPEKSTDAFHYFKKPEKLMDFLNKIAFNDNTQEPSIYVY